MKTGRALLTLALGVAFCPTLLADQVILKNGDRLTGTILKSDGESLTMASEFAGNVTIVWDAVTSVSSAEPLHVTLSDGQVLVGPIATSEGTVEIQTKEAGKVSAQLAAISNVRSEEEQAKHLAEIERLRNPGLLDLWSGFVDTGLATTRGNAQTTTFNLGMNAARATPRDKIDVYVTSLYATNSTTGVSLTTANAVRGGIKYSLNINERSYGFGFTDLEFDEFQQLDLRLTTGGGYGYHAVKNETTTLDVFGGGSLNKEFFSTGLNRTSGEILFGEELSHKISSITSLSQKLVVYPNMTDFGAYRVNFDASAVTNLNRWLAWQLTFSNRYLSNPVPGAKNNDMLFTTGLRLTFAR